MRIRIFAGLILSAVLGTAAALAATPDYGWYLAAGRSGSSPFRIGMGATTGMAGKQAAYLMGETGGHTTTRTSGSDYGAMERAIPLQAWRGKRVRLALRLKNEGDLHAWTSAALVQSDGNSIAAFPQKTAFGSGDWEAHQFVLDVPANADALFLDVGLAGKGMVWVDGASLEAVGSGVALSETRRHLAGPSDSCRSNNGKGSFSNCVAVFPQSAWPPFADPPAVHPEVRF